MPVVVRAKPLIANVIEESCESRRACAIIFAKPLATIDSKYGEMSEWLKEHAWK
jgi:hypothetical protein